jgi:hypothetical protein
MGTRLSEGLAQFGKDRMICEVTAAGYRSVATDVLNTVRVPLLALEVGGWWRRHPWRMWLVADESPAGNLPDSGDTRSSSHSVTEDADRGTRSGH